MIVSRWGRPAICSSAALAGVLVWIAAGGAVAQETVAPTPEQIQLFSLATEAYNAEEYDKSIELLESALEYGRLNLIYMSLGRAYFRKGLCSQAATAYDQSLAAPQATDPPPQAVKARIEAYIDELETNCLGVLLARCTPPDALVRVDGGEPTSCSAGSLEFAPGAHQIQVSYRDKQLQQEVVILGGREVRVAFDLGAPEVEPEPIPPAEAGMTPATWGWIGAGVGGAILVTAAVVELTVLGPAVEDFRADTSNRPALDDAQGLQSVVLGLYVAGGVVTAGGIVAALLLGNGEEAGALRWGIWPSSDGVAGGLGFGF